MARLTWLNRVAIDANKHATENRCLGHGTCPRYQRCQGAFRAVWNVLGRPGWAHRRAHESAHDSRAHPRRSGGSRSVPARGCARLPQDGPVLLAPRPMLADAAQRKLGAGRGPCLRPAQPRSPRPAPLLSSPGTSHGRSRFRAHGTVNVNRPTLCWMVPPASSRLPGPLWSWKITSPVMRPRCRPRPSPRPMRIVSVWPTAGNEGRGGPNEFTCAGWPVSCHSTVYELRALLIATLEANVRSAS